MPPHPDLAALVEPLLGLPYTQYDCWGLVQHLVAEGWGLVFDEDPQAALTAVAEVWFRGDAADPLTVVQPWDVVIFRMRSLASDHVGLVVTAQQFVHTRARMGLCLESLPKWRHHLLQVARLRHLL